MPKAVHMRRDGHGVFPPIKQWQEAAGSQCETIEEAEATIEWWREYDVFYSLTGWEYKIVDVKARKQR